MRSQSRRFSGANQRKGKQRNSVGLRHFCNAAAKSVFVRRKSEKRKNAKLCWYVAFLQRDRKAGPFFRRESEKRAKAKLRWFSTFLQCDHKVGLCQAQIGEKGKSETLLVRDTSATTQSAISSRKSEKRGKAKLRRYSTFLQCDHKVGLF